MSDTIPLCSRCEKPVNAKAFALALEQEPPESIPRELRFCPRCTISFEHWYWKRAKTPRTPGSRLKSERSSALPGEFSSKDSKRSHRRKKQVRRVFVVTSLTIVVFLVAFYWTWTILKTVARVDE
jgi:hypothetical protein